MQADVSVQATVVITTAQFDGPVKLQMDGTDVDLNQVANSPRRSSPHLSSHHSPTFHSPVQGVPSVSFHLSTPPPLRTENSPWQILPTHTLIRSSLCTILCMILPVGRF